MTTMPARASARLAVTVTSARRGRWLADAPSDMSPAGDPGRRACTPGSWQGWRVPAVPGRCEGPRLPRGGGWRTSGAGCAATPRPAAPTAGPGRRSGHGARGRPADRRERSGTAPRHPAPRLPRGAPGVRPGGTTRVRRAPARRAGRRAPCGLCRSTRISPRDSERSGSAVAASSLMRRPAAYMVSTIARSRSSSASRIRPAPAAGRPTGGPAEPSIASSRRSTSPTSRTFGSRRGRRGVDTAAHGSPSTHPCRRA